MMFYKSAVVAVLLAAMPAAADTLGSSARSVVVGSDLVTVQAQNVLSREELRSRLQEQRERANRLQADLLLTRQERDKLSAQVDRLRDARPEKNAEIREMRQEIRDLRQKQIDLEAENDRRALRIEELRTRLDNRNDQTASLRAENEMLRSQLAAVRDALKPQK